MLTGGVKIWPIRGYTRHWYTAMSFSKLISQALAKLLAKLFARALLSERLKQAKVKANITKTLNICFSSFRWWKTDE